MNWNFPITITELPPEADCFQALLEALTPDRPKVIRPPDEMDIVSPNSPPKGQNLMQMFNKVVSHIPFLSPTRSTTADATQGSPKEGEQPQRPRRNITRPQLYQSDEVAEQEKIQRKKGTI